jgi:hypothetical protein
MGARRIMHRANLRAFILDAARQAHPHWKVTQVKGQLLDFIEEVVKSQIRRSLRIHPPTGKTVRDYY